MFTSPGNTAQGSHGPDKEVPMDATASRPTPDAPAAWLSTPEVARMAGRDPRTIRNLAAAGLLPVHRPGGKCKPLYLRADVERFLATGKASAN